MRVLSRRIALTGATGFVGRHLLTALLEAGDEVRALVRQSGGLTPHPNLSEFQADLGSITAEFTQDIDVVIHLAGLIKAPRRADYAQINAVQAGRLAEMSQKAGVPKFIFLSSMAAREPDLSAYAWSKAQGEAEVSKAVQGDLSIIRAPAVFGPGDVATQPIFDLISKGWMPRLASKRSRLSVIYVKDLVRHILSVIDGDVPAGITEPATEANISWADFASAAGQAIDRDVRILPIPIWISWPVAAVTSGVIALGGPGHLGLGKLQEFRHPDWTASHPLDNPTPLIAALRETAESYEI